MKQKENEQLVMNLNTITHKVSNQHWYEHGLMRNLKYKKQMFTHAFP